MVTKAKATVTRLLAKMTGTDIHHLGECGVFGIALPEKLLAYDIAIRGGRPARPGR